MTHTDDGREPGRESNSNPAAGSGSAPELTVDGVPGGFQGGACGDFPRVDPGGKPDGAWAEAPVRDRGADTARNACGAPDQDCDTSAIRAWLRLVLTENIGPRRTCSLLAAFGLPEQVLTHSAAELGQVLEPALAMRLLATDAALESRIDATLRWWREGRSAVSTMGDASGSDIGVRARNAGSAGGSPGGSGGDAAIAAPPPRWLLTLDHPRYPRALLNLSDPPPLLYAIGDLSLLDRPAIALVGSRNASLTGADTARGFAAALGARGWAIVSGLAEGIDQAAHDGAVDSDGGTIAVVGTGVDRVYPKNALALAHRIAARGLLLSEQPLGTPPTAAAFPRRNRLIAALAAGTVVIEAAPRSGSLITARQAAELGREVMAVPGSIHSALARGCNALIREGASLVETVQHIESQIRLEQWPVRARAQPLTQDEWAARPRRGVRARPRRRQPVCADLSRDAGTDSRTGATGFGVMPGRDEGLDAAAGTFGADATTLQGILGMDPLSSERLANHLQWGIRRVLIGLQQLEVEGRVERLDDGRYRAVS